jgi:hypothetical protein
MSADDTTICSYTPVERHNRLRDGSGASSSGRRGAAGVAVAKLRPETPACTVTTGAVGLMIVLTLAATAIMACRRAVTRGEALALLVTYLATLPLLAG